MVRWECDGKDKTVSLSAVDMSSVALADGSDSASSTFEDDCCVTLDHSYLPAHFRCLADLLFRQVMKQLSCNVCQTVGVLSESLKNNWGLMNPSIGSVNVIRHKHCISCSSMQRFSCQPHSPVWHVQKTCSFLVTVLLKLKMAIDSHHFCIRLLAVSSFHKQWQYHTATLLQSILMSLGT